ncbi:MAG: glycosyltransferase family 4 protein [Bacteroidales bacterium]
MRIGIIIGRIGGVDGVARETQKWIEVLRSMGHRVFVLSGQFQERSPEPDFETLVPEMSFFSSESFWSQKRAFFYPETDPQELLDHILLGAGQICRHMLDWIESNRIEFLISENASALPSQLEMGQAIHMVVHSTGLPTITHDHEFAWDRGSRYQSPLVEIQEFIDEIFPLRAPNSVHAVINTNAADLLRERFDRDSLLVPNVMDFSQPFGQKTPVHAPLAEALGFGPADMILVQATRIMRRKGIHTAIELLHRLEDNRVKLLITGNFTDDAGRAYHSEMMDAILDLGLGPRVRFAHEHFRVGPPPPGRSDSRHSLSDAYALASGCTYFSSSEGFGNGFLEGILAKKPVFVNNYEPVFQTDIGSKGFRTVMIEHNQLTDEAVSDIARILSDPAEAKEIGEFNFELGKKHFGFDTLRGKLELLLDRAQVAAGS